MEARVPKFASFRSKKPTFKESQNSEEGDISTGRPRKREHHKKSKKPHEAKREHHGSGSNRASREPEVLYESDDSQNLFIVDRRGDSANLQYGTNSKHSVPEYHAPSRMSPLGARRARNLDESGNRGILSNRNRELDLSLRTEGEYIASDAASVNDEEVFSKDFLPFPNKRRKFSKITISARETEAREYENEKEQAEASSPNSSVSEVELEPENTGFLVRQKHALLLRDTKQHPQDIQAWLRFIEFQDQWIRQTSVKENVALTDAERRSIAEVKISLYQEALKYITPNQTTYETLLIGFLSEGAKVWESKKLLEQFQSLASSHPDCLDLQLKYIDVLQTRLSFFNYEKCLGQYSTYMGVLATDNKISPNEKIERQLYILLRLSSMIRDAGFKELSRCLWQAMIELNLFSPQETEHSFQSRLQSFEKFWDAEFIRVGEDGAPGWWQASRYPEPSQRTRQDETSDLSPNDPDDSDKAAFWLNKELKANYKPYQPSRTLDEPTDHDDPYNVVLFADIQPFLFEIEPKNHMALVDALLCFYQLPGLPGSENHHHRHWWHDTLLAKAQFWRSSASMELDIQSILPTTDTLLNIFQRALSSAQGNEIDPILLDDLYFVGHVLRALMTLPTVSASLREYYLFFIAATDKPKASKIAKALLKESPSDLILYNVYGMLELLSGNEKTGSHVFSTAIQRSLSFDNEADKLNALLLQRTWIWQGLRLNSLNTARNRLESTDQASHILTTLQKSRDAAIQKSYPINAALASELLALTSYLQTQSGAANLTAALETFSIESTVLATFRDIEASTYAVELLHQAQATLIAYHMQHQSLFSPSLIRSALRPSITSFPSNTMFLNLYSKNERRFRIDDRVRQIANDLLHGGGDAISDAQQSIIWCFSIKTELERGTLAASGATVHSIRAAFERAVNSESSEKYVSGRLPGPGPSASSVIWTAYLRWEVELANKSELGGQLHSKPKKRDRPRDKGDRSKDTSSVDDRMEQQKQRLQRAKQIWLRGVNALPWVKDFVLLGLDLLRDCLSAEEVRDYAYMMEDKGLRVHHHYDEVDEG